jgi:hypothetical protein
LTSYPRRNAKTGRKSKGRREPYIGSGTLSNSSQWGVLATFEDEPIALTVRESQKYREIYQEQQNKLANEVLTARGFKTLDDVVTQLKGLPFYRWDIDDYDAHNKLAEETGNRCCAVHAIGVPENKPGLPRGFFPYEKQVYDAMQIFDNIWIKKATGLGLSEFYLYYFLWLACKDDSLKNTCIGFITGPRLELTVMLMDRLKNLPILRDVVFNFFEINGVKFEAFPSNNLDSARGLPKVSYWFLDEADFWEKSLQEEARTVAERYIGKSHARVVMVSTPHLPDGLYDRIEHESPEVCIYHRIFLHWTVGVGYIYTEEDIARAKRTPAFPREYGLEYLGTEGDVFLQEELQHAIDLGANVNFDNPSILNLKSMGIDPGYSTSKYAIVVTNYNSRTRLIEIVFAHEYPKASPSEMTKKAWELAMRYNVTCTFIDASQNGPIREMKRAYGERWYDYEEHVKEVRAEGRHLAERMRVIPVTFDAHSGGEMITKCQNLFNRGKIAIPEIFRELIVQLRSARLNTAGQLDKKTYGTMDLFDAFRMAISYYQPYEKVVPTFTDSSKLERGGGGKGGPSRVFGL